MTLCKEMTSGSELNHIIKFTLPLLAGNIFQQVYNIADSIIVGKYLDYTALAAVGATSSITYLFYTICLGISGGTGILIAQSFGAKLHKEVKNYIVNSAYAIGMFGILLTIIGIIATPLTLSILNTPDTIFDNAVTYMRISIAGTIAVAAYNWISSVMRALGDSKAPLVFLVVSCILNVALDIIFIKVFKWGVGGAAWATITSQAVSAAGSIIFAYATNQYFRFNRKELSFNSGSFKKCIFTGIPIAMQSILISLSMIILQRAANGFGDVIVAAYTATMRVEQLMHQPFQSLNTAVSTFASQNIGAGKMERTIKGYKQSVVVSIIFAVIIAVVFLTFSRAIMGCFVDNTEVIDIGAKALKFSSMFYIFLGLIYITRGLLNGAGDVGYAFINGCAEFFGRVVFSFVLVSFTPMGIWAVWGTTCFTWVLTSIMSVIRYISGAWKNRAMV